MKRNGLVSFQVRHRETDLHIQAARDLSREITEWVIESRLAVETYAREHPGFIESHIPLPEDTFAHPVVSQMLHAAKTAGVGPMAAVAGAIAEFVGKKSVETGHSHEIIVENGGDIFLWTKDPVVTGVWAGKSPLSGRIGIKPTTPNIPLGICTSSGTVGHSRSFGVADAVTVISSSTPLADACATRVGNMIKNASDINTGLRFLEEIDRVLGGLIIVGSKIGAWGELELVPLG